MRIEERPLGEIKPYQNNAKKHPQKQVQQIADSIREFGFNQPIVVDKDNVIIVGHGRFLAAQALGLSVIPVVKVDISEDKARAYRLADNKLNESDWDMQLVIEELKTLDIPTLELTGFDRRLVLEGDENDDVVPPLPDEPKSKIGDIYELGTHRLLCGDSTTIDSHIKLFGNVKADMIFTDPPYNINYHGQGKNTSTKIMNDKMGDSQFLQFLLDCFKNWPEVTKKGAGMYIFHSPTTQAQFEDALDKSGMQVKYQLIWNKPSAGLGAGHYRNKHEPFFYATIKGVMPFFYGDRTHATIVDF
jgi:hypothetical protein